MSAAALFEWGSVNLSASLRSPILNVTVSAAARYCSNPMCVSNHERYLPELTFEKDGKRYCRYCEHEC